MTSPNPLVWEGEALARGFRDERDEDERRAHSRECDAGQHLLLELGVRSRGKRGAVVSMSTPRASRHQPSPSRFRLFRLAFARRFSQARSGATSSEQVQVSLYPHVASVSARQNSQIESPFRCDVGRCSSCQFGSLCW